MQSFVQKLNHCRFWFAMRCLALFALNYSLQAIASGDAPTDLPSSELKNTCPNSVAVNFMGDIFLSRPADEENREFFGKVRHLLRAADFNVANLEGVISEETQRAFPDFPFALRMRLDAAQVLAENGILHVTRSNNHSMDFGAKGMLDTNLELQKAGIAWAGVGNDIIDALQPLVLEKNGLKIAVAAFTTTYPSGAWASSGKPGVAFPTVGRLRTTIAELKAKFDYVVASFHWGEESSPHLRDHQVSLADLSLQSGADVVIGHHAHVAQAIAEKNGKWILYGLGNFVFNSNSRTANMGLLARLSFCGPGRNGPQKPPKLEVFPLDTLFARTRNVTKHMTQRDFLENSKLYFHNKLFPKKTPFRFYTEGETAETASMKVK